MTLFGWFAKFCRLLPRAWVEFLVGTVFVRWSMLLSPGRKKAARANFSRILKHTGEEVGPARLDALTEESSRLFARFILGMLCLPEDVEFSRTGVDLELLAPLETLRGEGRGVLIATPNFGLAAHCVWALLERGPGVTMPILQRRMLWHVVPEVYERIVTVGRSGRLALKLLAENKSLIMFSDINYLPQRRLTKFFGAPAPLSYAAAKASLLSGAPILPAYAVWDGRRARFEADAAIRPETSGRKKTLEEINGELAASMERWIGKYPGQWQVFDDFWDPGRMDRLYRMSSGLARD